jgi:hypothetical protein
LEEEEEEEEEEDICCNFEEPNICALFSPRPLDDTDIICC